MNLNKMVNSTVTLSDLSRLGVENMSPLLNGDQSFILGVTRKAKNIFQIIGVHDHRVTEGLAVSKFLCELRDRILLHFDGKNSKLFCNTCEKNIKDEVSLGNRGLIRIINANGEEVSICRNCFDGY